jgi:hypothetical protein
VPSAGTIELGGKTWDMYLPVPAIKEFEKISGVGWARTDEGNMTHMSAWVYVAIKYGLTAGARMPSQDRIDEWLTDADLQKVSLAIRDVLVASLPALRRETEEEKN